MEIFANTLRDAASAGHGNLAAKANNVMLPISLVMQRVGLSRPSIYRLMSHGDFPRPLRVGVRGVRWRSEDIDHWLAGREVAGSESRAAAGE